VTADEAKTKWCPFVRTFEMISEEAGAVASGSNRSGNGHHSYGTSASTACIASACMAWREVTIQGHQENEYNTAERPAGEGWQPGSPGPKNLWWWRQVPDRRVGYCGLAGVPS
jgi:hypothetical protein